MYHHRPNRGRERDNAPPISEWASRALDLDVQLSPVQVLVETPNLSLELELADYVNTKRANTPREAAFEVVHKVNSRIAHVGMLALHLLDILVKNCGYPMHLQIATKEFLNELVRRFPESPPVYPSVVQMKILEMIHEWRQTICTTSRHKEDLVHIRDMHRLLTYKGYRFPKLNAGSAAMLNQDRSLMSPEELEEEERMAQSAKLQELIRRGTPRDLAQAQELMKVMSGAEPPSENYAAQTAKELDKVVSRVKLLGDMLDQSLPGEKAVSGDAYDQVARHLRAVQPRLQRWITQAEENGSEHLSRYLEVNDMINQVFLRYNAFAKGEGAAKSDLISFDEPAAEAGKPAQPAEPAQPADKSAKGKGSVIDDLAFLSLDDGFSTSSVATPAPVPAATASVAPKTNVSAPTASAPTASAPPTAAPAAPAKQTSLDLLGDLDWTPVSSSASTAPKTFSMPAPSAPGPAAAPAKAQAHDPFADLDIFK
ncbi:ARF-binding protein [Malassezia cuniculi]|uniref:ARF-binding protein n=1 Tax=Malassezia cuniculi TaxID=948313 RepID=A0AAF0J5R6_9BASI|nr:ARF-binding protein [Malassezia cuniculi]